MTQFLEVDGGTLAYDVHGQGPLVVLAHGMGNSRQAYRFMVPELVAAGYQVANLDLRGCGESSVDWPSWSRTDIAGDILALVRHLGGPAVLVGHSIAGGAVTIAAAQAPELVTAVVELAPFTRAQVFKVSDLKVSRVRRGMTRLIGMALLGSTTQWKKYLEVANPGVRPADWDSHLAEIEASLREPGRMKALQKMGQTTPADAGAQLGNVRCPVLVIMGTDDPDWGSPQAEGEAVVAALPEGLGRLEMIPGAGHYLHTQYPSQVVSLMQSFLEEARA
ncbi:alpha/beta fold hydrolase [Kineosporia succinea]|uniref:Pimeloyl-ACP methyl ester carboxylesterase n=1 Tax=Kineosporia succinea TaxID=84632 RepID=A0ABT9P5X9_9ACTN|nr:alpha/beta hydrolase [Kineosporia succinea]MDP9828096.1 pimeloyl-ACP methyl ester carboxylesterase [Kineosporia succinea]